MYPAPPISVYSTGGDEISLMNSCTLRTYVNEPLDNKITETQLPFSLSVSWGGLS